MGIRFYCPNGHKLHVKAFQAGMRGICPYCGAKMVIPLHSTRPSTKELKAQRAAQAASNRRPDVAQTPEIARNEAVQSGSAMSAIPSSPALETPPVSPFDSLDPLLDHPLQTPSEPEGQGLPYRSMPMFEGLPGGAVPQTEAGYAQPDLRSFSLTGGSGISPTESDPLADPDVVWYVRPPSGGQYGPAAPQVVRAWLAEARITPDTLVWREGWRDWRLAREVFSSLGGAEFPQVSSGELPEMRFIRSARPHSPVSGVATSQRWVFFALSLLAALILAAVGTWFFFLR